MKWARVIADFAGETEEELSVKEGCVVEVIGTEEDGWATIRFDGREGLFPPAYLNFDIPPPTQEASSSFTISNEEDANLPPQEDELLDSPIGSDDEDETDGNQRVEEEEDEEGGQQETPEERAARKEEARRKHRINVIKEIRFTESDYVKDMEIVVRLFMHPLQEEGVLGTTETVALFSNVQVLLNVNQRLQEQLIAHEDDETIPIGKIFLEMVSLCCCTVPNASSPPFRRTSSSSTRPTVPISLMQ